MTNDWNFVKEYSHISTDSRDVCPGTLFVCKGKNFQRDYLLQAIERGAAAYVAETDYHVEIPFYPSDDVAASMAAIANAFYGEPWQKLELVGITGTKGKSTTLCYLKSIFESAGVPLAWISTIDTNDGVEQFESHLTTPEAFELGRHFANAVQSGIRHFAMEVSSQALKYKRTDGIRFQVGAFLNFGADHIGAGEHTDVEDYFSSKLKIFSQTNTAVVNAACERADEILAAAKKCRRVVTFSAADAADPLTPAAPGAHPAAPASSQAASGAAPCSPADYTALGAKKRGSETVFTLCRAGIPLGEIVLSMPGFFNIENAVCAAAIADLLGFSFEQIQRGLAKASAAGRMEQFEDKDRGLRVIVDYAHNELSFEQLFSSLRREYPKARIEALFGCPGGKGLSRRVDLPKVAARYCDFTWITEEDPFLDDPMEISREVLENLERFGGKGCIEIDRTNAIRRAVCEAAPGTILVITGKGREEYQHRKDGYDKIESDYAIVKRLLGK